MSVTTARKERERNAREELILDHAQRLLLRDGFQNLNLDELARAVEYSKGTIYLHFETKEDLTLAVATRALQERADMFERAATFTGRSRERARAIGFACCEFAVAHRDYFNIEIMLKSASFWEKASDERKRTHNLHAGRCFRSMNSIVEDAIRDGDLPRGTPSEQVVFSLIAVTLGSHIVGVNPDIQFYCGIANPLEVARRNQDLICDGWNWKPLLKEWDYSDTDRRIHADIFPESAWFKRG
jgi:AcrR family transcriptional regulator